MKIAKYGIRPDQERWRYKCYDETYDFTPFFYLLNCFIVDDLQHWILNSYFILFHFIFKQNSELTLFKDHQ